MTNNVEQDLYSAILECANIYSRHLDKCGLFKRIYPFTTENIAGYIKLFDLDNKSLLTVGSSEDQVINASLFNCKDITVIDINPFTKYYFYLKKAAIITLTYKEYLDFFLYRDYPKFCHENKQVFNKEKFNKFKNILKLEDYDSFYFWDELLATFPEKTIRKNLFSEDEDRDIVLKETNLYLKNQISFNQTKTAIKELNPKFICNNIMDFNLTRNYDNIFLSNLGQYLGLYKLKTLLDKLYPYVNELILICYLYQTEEDTKYNANWSEIYNLELVKKTLENYNISFNTFCGIKGILFEDEIFGKDSIITCDKRKIFKK